MENSLDPVHVEHLHGYYGNYVLSQQGQTPKVVPPRHERIAFDVFAYGIVKRRLLAGESEDCDEWQIGHPVLFPNTLSVGDERRPLFQIRVPVDDTHTLQYRYQGTRRAPDAPPHREVRVTREEWFNAQGEFVGPPEAVPPQDMLAWVEQGALVDRTQEHLATSDKGIILYRKLLLDSVAAIERGESRAMPHTPWPEVQPPPSRVPKPTSNPAAMTIAKLAGICGGAAGRAMVPSSSGAAMSPIRNARRHPRSSPVSASPRMPLTPAMRPLRSISSTAASPMRPPPMSAETGSNGAMLDLPRT
jgi:hypothetical protein